MSYMLSNKDKEKKILKKIQLFLKKSICNYMHIVHVKYSKMLCKAYKMKFHTPFIENNYFEKWNQYKTVIFFKNAFSFFVLKKPYFWGDICGWRIISRYFRHLDRSFKFSGEPMLSTNILRYGKVHANDFSMSYMLSNKH